MKAINNCTVCVVTLGDNFNCKILIWVYSNCGLRNFGKLVIEMG